MFLELHIYHRAVDPQASSILVSIPPWLYINSLRVRHLHWIDGINDIIVKNFLSLRQ